MPTTERRAAGHVPVYVSGLLTVAVVAVVVAVPLLASGPVPVLLAVAVALGVVAAEVQPAWTTWRPRDSYLVVPELFVGVALVTLPPRVALVTLLVGVVVAAAALPVLHPLRRGRPPTMWIPTYTVAMPTARVVAAVAAAAWLGPLLGVAGAAVGGLTAAALTDVACAHALVWARGLERNGLVDATAVGNGVIGLLVGVVGVGIGGLATGAFGWLVVLTVAGALVVCARICLRAAAARSHTWALWEVVTEATAASAQGRDAVVELVVDRAAAAVHAQRAAIASVRPAWADVAVPLGEHGWLAVADRDPRLEGCFDDRDVQLLAAVAAAGRTALDNADLVERLERADRVRSMLLAAVAHDLRGPLALTQMSLTTLGAHGDTLDAPGRGHLVSAAERGVAKASRLVADLIEHERARLAPSGDAATCVRAAIDRVLRELPPEDAARCDVRLETAAATAAVDPSGLERVVDNLVSNALQHSPPDGRVTIRVASTADTVTLAVEDRGPGVPVDQRQDILAPFVHGGRGVGLGLHIAVEFVRDAGGELHVEDRTDGPGAAFVVTLPAAVPAGTGPGDAATAIPADHQLAVATNATG